MNYFCSRTNLQPVRNKRCEGHEFERLNISTLYDNHMYSGSVGLCCNTLSKTSGFAEQKIIHDADSSYFISSQEIVEYWLEVSGKLGGGPYSKFPS